MQHKYYTRKQLEQILFSKREIDPITNCWVWTGHWTTDGYGGMYISQGRGRKFCLVHIVAARLWKGTRIRREVIARDQSKCSCRACFNPDHLLVFANKAEQTKCRIKAGEFSFKGEKALSATITETTAIAIRDALVWGSETPTEIAKRLKIARHIVYQIKTKRTWKHVWDGFDQTKTQPSSLYIP